MELFRFENVTYGYIEEEPVLREISFSVSEGKKTAIVGTNGAGKSTILFHLNGLYKPQKGDIYFRGEKLNKKDRKNLIRYVGVVFQDPDDQIISLTVKEDIGFGPHQLGVETDKIKARTDYYLDLLDIKDLAEKNPAELSYGQKKHVTIAGILAMETDVFIFDEPMAFLDPKGKEKMFNIFNLLESQGKTLIVTTHDMQFVAEWADEIIVIEDGKSLGTFTASGLFSNKEVMEKANLTLPPSVEIMKSIWNGNQEDMPIRMKDVMEWLKNNNTPLNSKN